MDRSWSNCLRARSIKIVLAIAIALISIACSNIFPPNPQITNESVSKPRELTIWWEQGYNLEEDQALQTVVNNWQKQTGYKAKLSFFTNDELIPKVERAVEANQLPDLMMSSKGNQILYPRLAWQDRLEDVADLIQPIQADYSQKILQAITYSNNHQGKRSYYGVPVHQSIILIFYWQKLLASVGLKPSDIPPNWDDFWQFWQQVQVKLKEQNLDIYSFGFPLAGDKRADDTHYLFEQILEANNINLLNDRGELEIDRPKIRQGIIKCLNWYAQLYQQGYIPPNAVNWSNTDNNLNLLNRLVLMTPNATLSIPATVHQDADTYYNQLGIAEFPHKPNGESMRYLLSIRQAVIFKNSLHKSLAKKFIRYFIQPQVTIDYLKATNGRGQPVRKSVWSDPFWQNSKDPYIATVTKILTKGQTRLSYEVEHPAYSQVLAENVWGQALTQVTAEQVKPEQAAKKAIARIKAIFAEWDQQ